MISAASLRSKGLLRTQRYHSGGSGPPGVSRLINGEQHGQSMNMDRCFSTGKEPPDEFDNNSRKVKQNTPPSKGLRRSSQREGTWGNQVQCVRSQRRPRFGPKSQKFFQAATSPNRKYGIRSLNLKLIKDSSNVPILLPGRALDATSESEETAIHKTDDSTKRGDQKQPPRRRKLPIVNVSALLDKTSYCKKSAYPGGVTTRSGTEAAKRLLRGKKDLVEMIRGNIIYQQAQRPFCLAGHGIPKQLLEDHLNMADSILKHFNEPAECKLNHLHGNSTDPSFPDSMTIRSRDGQSRNWPWPPQRLLQKSTGVDDLQDVSETFEHSLILYLAAMDRISKQLGQVGSNLNKDSRKNWTVKMFRGMAYPLDVISRPDDEEDGRPVPILEWSPVSSTGGNKPHITIRLQGTPNGDTEEEAPAPSPVTLIYDAIFQEDPRVEPVRATPA